MIAKNTDYRERVIVTKRDLIDLRDRLISDLERLREDELDDDVEESQRYNIRDCERWIAAINTVCDGMICP